MEYNTEKISNKIAVKKFFSGFIKKILIIVLLFTSIINIILLFYNFQGEKNPQLMNMYFFNIISESMEPAVKINDIIIVKNVSVESLNVGDIITFLNEGKIISHRIIEKKFLENETVFKTKGDNNVTQDNFYVHEKDVYGKVVFRIPKIGEFVEYIKDKKGLIKAILIVQVFFICITINQNRKNKRKILRKKYEIKKKRENYR